MFEFDLFDMCIVTACAFCIKPIAVRERWFYFSFPHKVCSEHWAAFKFHQFSFFSPRDALGLSNSFHVILFHMRHVLFVRVWNLHCGPRGWSLLLLSWLAARPTVSLISLVASYVAMVPVVAILGVALRTPFHSFARRMNPG